MSTHHDKLGSFSLPEYARFDGSNFENFKRAFRLMLILADKLYIVDEKEVAPASHTAADRQRDSLKPHCRAGSVDEHQ